MNPASPNFAAILDYSFPLSPYCTIRFDNISVQITVNIAVHRPMHHYHDSLANPYESLHNSHGELLQVLQQEHNLGLENVEEHASTPEQELWEIPEDLYQPYHSMSTSAIDRLFEYNDQYADLDSLYAGSLSAWDSPLINENVPGIAIPATVSQQANDTMEVQHGKKRKDFGDDIVMPASRRTRLNQYEDFGHRVEDGPTTGSQEDDFHFKMTELMGESEAMENDMAGLFQQVTLTHQLAFQDDDLGTIRGHTNLPMVLDELSGSKMSRTLFG
jgi:hypothetical protein